MQILLNIVLIIIAVIWQFTVMPKIAINGAFPNIILVVMLALIFIKKSEQSLLWAVLGGILLDIFSAGYFGVFTATLIIIHLIFRIICRKVFASPPLYIAALLFFIASLLFDAYWVVEYRQWTIYFYQTIYNTLVGCLIYYFIGYYNKPKEGIKI